MRTFDQYKPVQVGVDTTETFYGSRVFGFIPKTAGTVTITAGDEDATVIVDAFPVVAGTPLPLPFLLPNGAQQGTVTTAGGASGILAV